MARSVGVATLTKNISSCQINDYFAAVSEQMDQFAEIELGLLTFPGHADTANMSMEAACGDENRPDQGQPGVLSTFGAAMSSTVSDPVD